MNISKAKTATIMNKFTIQQLQQMRESEDRVEFKAGEGGNVSYDGRGKTNPKDRRRCILGYVIALCNEGGGRLVIGMHDIQRNRATTEQLNAFDLLALYKVSRGESIRNVDSVTLKKLLSQELLIETSDGIKLTPLYDEMKLRAGVTDKIEDKNVLVNDTAKLSQLTERQKKIYHIIKDGTINDTVNDTANDTVTAKTLSEALGASIITIKRDLAAMQSVGVIKRVGSDKTGHWEAIVK